MTSEHIGQIAGLISFSAFIPYISSILMGKTKPARSTSAIWTAVDVVTLISYFAVGARSTTWVVLSFTICQFAVFLLSLKCGVGGKEPLDILCLIGAATGIFLWLTTKNPAVALYFGIAAELLGYLPVIKKSYLNPETESSLAWNLGALGALVNLFAITSFSIQIALYPVAVFVADTSIALVVLISTNHRVKQQLRANHD